MLSHELVIVAGGSLQKITGRESLRNVILWTDRCRVRGHLVRFLLPLRLRRDQKQVQYILRVRQRLGIAAGFGHLLA